MAPSRRKGASKAALAAAARRQWKIGDLVLAKVKGFPAWPATVSEPEKWGYSSDWKKVLVYFFGTKQIAFCNPADVEEFTEEKKISLLGKRQGRGSDFVRAVQEIVDCYEKLKENVQVDQSGSGEPPENVGGCDLNAGKTVAPDLPHDSTTKVPNPSMLKVEQNRAVDDVGALTKVESLNQRAASEEPADNAVGTCMPLPYTYTLRKKSRSSQPQRCASQKNSVQGSRSSVRFDSRGTQNEDLKCNDKKNSGDGAINGFWDGPLRRAKRSKRSPDGSAPSVGGSPVCFSNGTVEDNGSEVAMADSEILSNNEGSATESNHKHDQFEIHNDSCGEGRELSKRLDLHSTSAVVRKKRNPGRRRVCNDAAECASRVDQEVNMDIHPPKESSVLSSTSCENGIHTHPKEEGDEHLPLVKRARVRMGKLLSEEQQQQFDLIVKSEDKPMEPHPANISLSREPVDSVDCDNINFQKTLSPVVDSIGCSLEDNCTNVPDTKSPEKPCLVVADEPVACLGSNSCAGVPENKPQPWKAKTTQAFGCAFDGEAALPPSKRLHRALEAMSANAAKENQTLLEESLSEETDSKTQLAIPNTCSNELMEVEAVKKLDSEDESLNCNNTSYGECILVPKSSIPLTCEIANKLSEDMVTSVPDTRILDSTKVESALEIGEVAISRDNTALCGSGDTGVSGNALQEKALPDECISKDGNEEGCKNVTKNNEMSMVHSERAMSTSSGEEEAVAISDHDGAFADACDIETNSSAFGSARHTADVNTKSISTHETLDEVTRTTTNVNLESSLTSLGLPSILPTFHGSGDRSHDIDDVRTINRIFTAAVDGHEPVSQTNDVKIVSDKNNSYRNGDCSVSAKLAQRKLASVDECNSLVAGMNLQEKSRERFNLAEVKAALASLELTLGSLTRTKESIGKATKIAVDCVKFGVATEVVELLATYLEKESSLHKRVDLFFLVDSIAQCCRSLKDPIEAGGTYISAVKETLARMLSAAAPPGHAAKENRRQCLKVLRLWLERRILPDSIIRHHIRELESHYCSSSTGGGFSRRMCRTERSFDDPLRDMEGMFVDEYGSNSSIQLPGFCMPRMLKEEDDGSDSDGGSFEAVTPEHESVNKESCEVTTLPAIEKHRHILEDVDGELEMEDVAPCGDANIDPTPTVDNAVLNTHHSGEQFTAFVPPLPHDAPPHGPPLPTSPPPPRPPPPPPPPVPHVSTMSQLNVDPQLRAGRNETMSSCPPAPVMHHPLQMSESTSSSSFSSYPLMHNPVGPGNNIQQADTNLCPKSYNLRPPYPSTSNQFSYFQADHQIRPQRETAVPSYYERPHHYGQNVESGHFYADQDSMRPPRHELTDCWGYGRPTFPAQGPVHTESDKAYPPMYHAPMCEPPRPNNHGWTLPPRPMHHRNHIPNIPPCDGPVPVAVRGPGCWRPR